ncbi:hypothetical protein MAPG_07777 [Magnaporthiopsis poae ATCC 64411]|uniref:Uncharacterized protein n=1 Tax=Magnaporthiopsis poae (strain ATCC 64411 / 73-15) TaxID=644358 RepID=A0A0C4E5K5_MAGP6|nr:hypothetical protein MAPG_07777 [Magnaporthiopsis poae ATCC 64411]
MEAQDVLEILIHAFNALRQVIGLREKLKGPPGHYLEDFDLPAMAAKIRDRDATDPRDKVYGILGLCPGIKTEWVSYGMSVEETYIRSARESIKHRGRLDILTQALGNTHSVDDLRYLRHVRETSKNGGSSRQLLSLPSWVPDWSRKVDFPSPFLGIAEDFTLP